MARATAVAGVVCSTRKSLIRGQKTTTTTARNRRRFSPSSRSASGMRLRVGSLRVGAPVLHAGACTQGGAGPLARPTAGAARLTRPPSAIRSRWPARRRKAPAVCGTTRARQVPDTVAPRFADAALSGRTTGQASMPTTTSTLCGATFAACTHRPTSARRLSPRKFPCGLKDAMVSAAAALPWVG